MMTSEIISQRLPNDVLYKNMSRSVILGLKTRGQAESFYTW